MINNPFRFYQAPPPAPTYFGGTLPTVNVRASYPDDYVANAVRRGGSKFLGTALGFMGQPQRDMVELFTGVEQTPSEALGISSPVGAFLTDAVLDPLNIGVTSIGGAMMRNSMRNPFRVFNLSNAYKYNPLAFKAKKGKIYRQVGQPGFDNAITERKIFDKGQKQFLEANPEINYLDEYNQAIKFKGLNLKKPSPAPFFSKDELFFPIDRKAVGTGNKKTKYSDAEYLFEGSVPEEALLPRYRDAYLKPTEATTNTFVLRPEYNDLSNFKLYKRDWLRGYRRIK